jgi:hypothetical protein
MTAVDSFGVALGKFTTDALLVVEICICRGEAKCYSCLLYSVILASHRVSIAYLFNTQN